MSSYRILYGDIHNHNAHGYGVGSIERSLEIARTHPAGNRDGKFCAFLGFEWHSSQWGDQCVVFPRDHLSPP